MTILVPRWLAISEHQGTLIVGDNVERAGLADLLFVEHEVPQDAAEGLFQVLLRESLDRGSIGKHGAVEEDGAIAELRHAAKVVSGDEHHPAFIAKRSQELDDGVFGVHVDAGERFVEQDHAPVLGQRAGEEDTLLLTTGEFADLTLAKIDHADASQCHSDRLMIGGPGDAHHVHVAVAAHHHDILDENGEIPIDVFALWNISDNVLLQCGIHRLAENGDLAPGKTNETHDCLEQGGFAAAVHSDQCGDGAGRDLETRIAQGGVTVAVSDSGVSDRKARSRIRTRGSEKRIDHGAHCARPVAIVSDVTRSRSI
jgi:hypothetical protein